MALQVCSSTLHLVCVLYYKGVQLTNNMTSHTDRHVDDILVRHEVQ